MSEYSMKSLDFAEAMKAQCWSIKSVYKDSYPLNCNYYYGNGTWGSDCVCNIKSNIWSRCELPKTQGKFVYEPNKYGLGDLTCKEMIEACSDVTSDFSKKIPCELMYIPHETNPKWGHVGLFVGDFTKKINGVTYTYNTIESSPIWNGGMQSTYVDNQGRRFRCKGGEQSGVWQKHGRMTKWLDYSDQVKEVYTVKQDGSILTVETTKDISEVRIKIK